MNNSTSSLVTLKAFNSKKQLARVPGEDSRDYFTGGKTDYVNARRIINEYDAATSIAKSAREYFRCKSSAKSGPVKE